MKYFLCSLAGALLVFLLMRACNKPIPPSDNKARDSAFFHERDSLKSKIISDSLEKVSERNVDDSDRENFLNDKQTTEDALKAQVVQLTFDRNKFRTASEGKDTGAAMQACRDYMVRAQEFYAKGLKYKSDFDSIVSNGSERRKIDSTERVLNYQTIGQDGRAIDTLTKWYNKADSSYRKTFQLLQKADKRFSIGPYIGITYDSKFKPSYGIGVSYRLFKF